MAKYDPLRDYLRRQTSPILEMTFREIEAKIGYMLPNISAHAAWWSAHGTSKDVQQMAWTAANYRAELITGADRVRFTRLDEADGPAADPR